MKAEIRTDIKGIERFIFAPGADPERLHLHISEVDVGMRAHAPHEHEGQEIFFVLNGEAEAEVGEETHRLTTGEAIQVEGSVLHGIRNVGRDSLRYAVIIAKP
ncbi:TPA: cupin domain-containing protein [Candidatus Poribacteria bacterium]|nr:cupin domain-containing protein [Candidatus Poribacteria bacterium]